ncbi:hypothetical protein [Pinirhizobacter soli]|uniref:hypothetical protein n=1 Tax=Pinirhizobacter soli TaxID=2786953 RepID=UPI00202ABF58|nr:hypothetical protein [Pinirhizobacter soli]
MKIWKNFLPRGEGLGDLTNVRAGPYFVDSESSQKWLKVFFQKEDGNWLALEWNYFDVEFKFEVYGISIDHLESVPPSLVKAGATPTFSELRFLLETDWTRPAKPGEVPENFDQIVEECGALSEIPDAAISAGTALRGVIFSNDGGESKLVISIDDTKGCSLKSTVDPDEMDLLGKAYDVLTLSEALAWTPPH